MTNHGRNIPPPLDRPATLEDVASRARVSTATVSRVLSGTYPVAQATAAKVRRVIHELDYVRNAHARSLAGAPSRLIAVLTSELLSGFYNAIMRGVEKQALAEDRFCVLGTTDRQHERELALITMLREQNAEAIVLIGGVVETPEYRRWIASVAKALDAAGSRLILCGRPSPGDDLPITVVEYDAVGGAYGMTSHLLAAGHRRILFFGGVTGTSTTKARWLGYRNALQAHGVEVDPALTVTGQSHRAWGYETMTRMLAARKPAFTAVFGCDDLVAFGALSALRDRGVRVPEDISVSGFDDNSFGIDTVPKLTTVHVPAEQLGRSALHHALHRHEPEFQSQQHLVLGTHIVVRDSIRPRKS